MRKAGVVVGMLFAGLVAGCATGGRVVNSPPPAPRSGIFVETTEAGPLPGGTAEMEIRMRVKTPHAGYFLLGSGGIPHGTAEYTVLLNIDGQAVEWKLSGFEETRPALDSNGTRTPEGGKGVVYVLKKKIRISPGSHRVFFSLPAEDASTGIDITVKEKGIYSLVLAPVYGKGKRYPNGYFTKGVRKLRETFSLTWVQCG